MKKTGFLLTVCIASMWLAACSSKKHTQELEFVNENIAFATQQFNRMIASLPNVDSAALDRIIPVTTDAAGRVYTSHPYGWTIGFFPGSLWQLYELTKDTVWMNRAASWTHRLEYLKRFTDNHDIGFMMYCSYGNANRLAPRSEYKKILVESANALSTRFIQKAQIIKSWNYRKAWNDTTEWFCPVVIDNVMNLELLCKASEISGDKRYKDIAITHARTTLKNHFRPDFSTYHVVDYDTISGKVKDRATCQGYSDCSTWSRGQAWAIYGYTLMYHETRQQEFLDVALQAADYFISHLPEDGIPLWDFNVGQAGFTPEGRSFAVKDKTPYRDASAGSIASSALFELGELSGRKKYIRTAIKILHRLGSPAYRAAPGTNGNFLLMHSVSSLPHHAGINRPSDYNDYYFLEALNRYRTYLLKK